MDFLRKLYKLLDLTVTGQTKTFYTIIKLMCVKLCMCFYHGKLCFESVLARTCWLCGWVVGKWYLPTTAAIKQSPGSIYDRPLEIYADMMVVAIGSHKVVGWTILITPREILCHPPPLGVFLNGRAHSQ